MPSKPAIAATAPRRRAGPPAVSAAAYTAWVRSCRMAAPASMLVAIPGALRPSSVSSARARVAARCASSAATSVSNATGRASSVLTRATERMPIRIAATRFSVASSAPSGASMPDSAMIPTV